jgi:hypothetical protein
MRLPLDSSHTPAPHLEENHLRQIIHYCNFISPYIYAEMQHSSSFLSSLPCNFFSLSYNICSPSPIYPLFTHFFSEYRYTPSSPLLSTPTLYKSAITAPTTPNNPTPTFTLPAAFFPVVLAALPAPELVVLGVPLPDVELALVFVPLALVVVIVLWVPVITVTEVEAPEEVVEEAAAEDTVFVEMIENWFE